MILIDALGVIVGVQTSDQGLAGRLRTAWAGCLAPPGSPADVVVTYSPEDGISLEESMELVTQRVTVEAIGARAGDLVMLHACALADPDSGRAVVLVGPSGAGKTTVALTHGSRWAYVTDETAAVDADGTLIAYPKPLSVLRTGPVKEQVPAGRAGLRPTPASLRVSGMVLLDRDPSSPGLDVELVPTAPAVVMLTAHTSYLTRLARPLGRLAELVGAAGGLRRARYAEALELAPLLEELLTGPEPATPATPATFASSPDPDLDPVVESDTGRLWGRMPVLDEVVVGAESALLLPSGRALALSALATRALAVLAAGGADELAVASALVEEFGPPPGDPDARQATRRVLGDLHGLGVIRQSD